MARTRNYGPTGPSLFTLTIATADNSLVRCLFGAFGAHVTWDAGRKIATVSVDCVGLDTIGLIASMGPIAVIGLVETPI